MVFDSKQFLRDGSTNLTANQSSPAASGANKGSLALMTGLPRKGMWLKAYTKSQITGTSAVNTLHATASPTGGTYTLSLGSGGAGLGTITSAAIAFGATPAAAATALCAACTATTPLYLNGRWYTSLTGATDITGSGAAFGTGDLILTFSIGGKLQAQPALVSLNSDVATTLTGGNTYVVQSTTAGMDIVIVGTDGTKALQSSGSIHINGATQPFQEMAVLIEAGNSFDVTGGIPLTAFNYNATVTGTPVNAPIIILLDETAGGLN